MAPRSRKRVILLGSGSQRSTFPTQNTRNPKYIPPNGDSSPIEELLPPELLGYIFEIGTRAEELVEDWAVEEDDGDENYEDVDSDDTDSDDEDMPCLERLGTVKIMEDDPSDAANTAEERIRNLPFQVRMSHVCRRWRQVAIDSPVLWTSLSFSESSPFQRSREWIARSKQSPLDINIDITLPDEDIPSVAGLENDDADAQAKENAVRTTYKDLSVILHLALPHVARWRTFELSVSTYVHMFLALRHFEKCPADPGAPLLQTLSLFCHDDSEDPEFEHFAFDELKQHYLLFGGHTPRLAQVGLWGVHLDWNMLVAPSARSAASLDGTTSAITNLTDLELAYHARDVRPSYDEFVKILRCAPNLSSLKLSCSGPAPRQHGPPEPLLLRNLRTLRLSFIDELYTMELLRLLYAPGLMNITLDFDDGDYSELVQQLVSPMRLPDPITAEFKVPIYLAPNSSASPEGVVIDPSTPASILANITDVKLSGMPCSDQNVYKFYAACPRLKRLHLNMHFLPLAFFTLLVQETEIMRTRVDGVDVEVTPIDMHDLGRSSSKPLCPRLESLTTSGIRGEDLVTLVRKRKSLGIPIRELNLDKSEYILYGDEEWLRNNTGSVKFVEFSDNEDYDAIEDNDEDEDGDGEEDMDEEDVLPVEN